MIEATRLIEQPWEAGALSPGAMLAIDAGNGEVDLARDSTSPSQHGNRS